MTIKAVFFDLGETLIDEQRMWKRVGGLPAHFRRELVIPGRAHSARARNP
jgi:FMN phosphatase YigB (HAD superfamily)